MDQETKTYIDTKFDLAINEIESRFCLLLENKILPKKQLLSRKDIAIMLNCSLSTADKYLRKGKDEGYINPIGTKISAKEIEEYNEVIKYRKYKKDGL